MQRDRKATYHTAACRQRYEKWIMDHGRPSDQVKLMNAKQGNLEVEALNEPLLEEEVLEKPQMDEDLSEDERESLKRALEYQEEMSIPFDLRPPTDDEAPAQQHED